MHHAYGCMDRNVMAGLLNVPSPEIAKRKLNGHKRGIKHFALDDRFI